ncbi:hypothetical protein [Microbacterium sp. Gd 4-13]|uniref:hypothetical protein n=1 Tax=Microbacterium sp. Gd 4-13 TaxID=2173179 RepID=UPI000E31A175|nr:hypothetical protein [Microbacterium sp. Gd 4-13]
MLSITAAAAAMLAADYAMSYAGVMALFGLPFALIALPIVAAVLAAVVAWVSKAATGRWHVVGAIAVTVLLGTVVIYGFLVGILRPLVLQEDLPLHLAVCALCALTYGLFLGLWPLRILGGAAGVGLVILVSAIPTAAEESALQAAETSEQMASEQLDYYLTSGAYPFITELEGWQNTRVRPTGSEAATWLLSDDGAAAKVIANRLFEETGMDATFPCTMMSRGGDAGPATEGALPEWCVKTETGWERSDGLALAYIEDSRLVVIDTPEEYEAVFLEDSQRPANAQEIAAVAASLRPMTDAEIERWVLPVYDSVNTPEIETPGL